MISGKWSAEIRRFDTSKKHWTKSWLLKREAKTWGKLPSSTGDRRISAIKTYEQSPHCVFWKGFLDGVWSGLLNYIQQEGWVMRCFLCMLNLCHENHEKKMLKMKLSKIYKSRWKLVTSFVYRYFSRKKICKLWGSPGSLSCHVVEFLCLEVSEVFSDMVSNHEKPPNILGFFRNKAHRWYLGI